MKHPRHYRAVAIFAAAAALVSVPSVASATESIEAPVAAVAEFAADYPTWVAGVRWEEGDIVRYEGGLWIATNTISAPSQQAQIAPNSPLPQNPWAPYTPAPAPAPTVTVEGGSVIHNPSGEHYIGQTVVIRAEEPRGYLFSHWTVEQGGVELHNVNAIETHFFLTDLTDLDVVIKAHFDKITVNVTGGEVIHNPSGLHYVGQTVVIRANDDVAGVGGSRFIDWAVNNGGMVLHNPEAQETHFYLVDPTAANIEIAANFAEIKEVIPSAVVTRQNGAENLIEITVTEVLSNETEEEYTETFAVPNNFDETFTVGDYQVFVSVRGNTQVREISIVS